MNDELEKALHYAAEAGDINSLKALARQEASSADRWRRILTAVIQKTGPVDITSDEQRYSERSDLMAFISSTGMRLQVTRPDTSTAAPAAPL